MRPDLRRPVPLAIAFGLFAEALFAFRVTTPHRLVFDEVHYVPAARALTALSGPRNIEHPLLAKLLIALSMRLFGDDALGWRALSTVAGAAVVAGIVVIAWLIWRRTRPAGLGGVGVSAGGLDVARPGALGDVEPERVAVAAGLALEERSA